MTHHVDRMTAELAELKGRILALSERVFSLDGFPDYDARVLAFEQLKTMQQYAEVLLCRIEYANQQ